MADESSLDDLFAQPPEPATVGATASAISRPTLAEAYGDDGTGAAHLYPSAGPDDADDPRRPGRRPRGRGDRGNRRRRSRFRWIWGVITVLLVLGIGATAAYLALGEPIRAFLAPPEPTDYPGEGTGEVVVTITNGQTGGDVAKTLADAGVTRSYEAFYGLLLQNPDITFQPGSYKLKSEMSAAAALTAITDPANKVFTQVTIPEGTTVEGVLARLADVSDSTGIGRPDLDAAAADLASFGLPAEAPRLEGYLFPATYSFDPGLTAHDILKRMVDEMFTRLDTLGVPPEDRHRVLTLAALTQKEGGSSNDFFKVARVWENRLAQGMRLESDATVSYGVGGTTIDTTEAERADASNPYNTYARDGLPVGPISNPGEAAIEATISPAEGPWLFFVLVNGETGETAFSTTFDEHLGNVEKWRQWVADHPDFSG